MDRFDVWKLVLDAGGAFMFVFSSIILTTCQDKIAEDRETHGSMFVTVILGSNKTMVSVATGHNEFYPLYASLGNVHNSVWCAHRNAVSLVGFLAMPKSMCLVMFSLSWIICPIASREFSDSADFQKFCCQLFHTSLEHILSPLWPFMMKPHITKCGDGHWRCVIYGLGPYIADYSEQALLACVVQGWCAKCVL